MDCDIDCWCVSKLLVGRCGFNLESECVIPDLQLVEALSILREFWLFGLIQLLDLGEHFEIDMILIFDFDYSKILKICSKMMFSYLAVTLQPDASQSCGTSQFDFQYILLFITFSFSQHFFFSKKQGYPGEHINPDWYLITATTYFKGNSDDYA